MKKSIDTLTVTDFLRALYYPTYRRVYNQLKELKQDPSAEFADNYERLKEFEEYSITDLEITNYIEKITGGFKADKKTLLFNEYIEWNYLGVIAENEVKKIPKGRFYFFFPKFRDYEFALKLIADNAETVKELSLEIIPYLQKAQQAGYLDESYRLIKLNNKKKSNKLTRVQQRLFSLCCSVEVGNQQGGKSYNDELEKLWETKNLSGYKYETASANKLQDVLEWFGEETRNIVTQIHPEIEPLRHR